MRDAVLRLAGPAQRPAAAETLARHLGVERLMIFIPDPELGVLLPAPGFPQTIAGGAAWRAFLRRCATPGVHRDEVDWPRGDATSPVLAHVAPDGLTLLLFGADPDAGALAELVAWLPLIGALFRSELAARLAHGEAEVARASGRRARELAIALDAARGELERALTESARLNAELQDIDRRKDEFMAMLGHELRNPMSAICSALEVMRLRPDDDGRARRIIERQTAQLSRLVDDLLDVARISLGKIVLRREQLAVEQIVRNAIDAARPLIDARGHDLRLDVRAAPHVDADHTRLDQMVTNLLTNAAKYTDPGGHIRIVVDRDGDDALIVVEDDGIGIAPAMLPRIFDVFQQVVPSIDRASGGLGVGLTVVSRLAALHGGRVHAISEPGRGSTFTLRLPALPAGTPDAAPDLATPPPAARRRVLIVDDNVDAAEMLATLAQVWGHETVQAHDGPTAVAVARERRPDIVLLDIGLPGMDGYEVATALRSDPRTRDARIIAVSGYGLAATASALAMLAVTTTSSSRSTSRRSSACSARELWPAVHGQRPIPTGVARRRPPRPTRGTTAPAPSPPA